MIKNPKLNSGRAAEKLRDLILRGEYQPGAPLRQTALSARLGVSRTPLRQALQILDDEGIVQQSDFRGASVATIDAALLDDLFDMRQALESIALKSAFGKQTKLDFAAAEMALDAADNTTDPAALSQFNWEFHMALYRPSGRAMLLESIQRLNRSSALAEAIGHAINDRITASADEHLAILAACRSDDQRAALDLLNAHLKAAHNGTLASLLEDKNAGH